MASSIPDNSLIRSSLSRPPEQPSFSQLLSSFHASEPCESAGNQDLLRPFISSNSTDQSLSNLPIIDEDGFITVTKRRQRLNQQISQYASEGNSNKMNKVNSPNSNLDSVSGRVVSHGFNYSSANIKARTWSEIVSGDKVSVQFPLQYFPPENVNGLICARNTFELSQKARSKWNNSIVLYVLGSRPYYQYLKAYIIRVWKPQADFQIYSRENGFYIVNFESNEDCDRILMNGPYFYDRKLVMMKKWCPGMKLNKQFLSSIPIWVRLPGLDLDYWTEEMISRIVSVIGKPLKLDQITKGMIRIDFARVLVEIDSDSKFPNKIPIINQDDNISWQVIEYEWLPPICKTCNSFGHTEAVCKSVKIWVQKISQERSDLQMDIDNSAIMSAQNNPDMCKSKIVASESLPEQISINNVNKSNTCSGTEVVSLNRSHKICDHIMEVEKNSDQTVINNVAQEETKEVNSDSINLSHVVHLPTEDCMQTDNQFNAGSDADSFIQSSDQDISLDASKEVNDISAPKQRKRSMKSINSQSQIQDSHVETYVIDNPKWIHLIDQIKPKSKIKKKGRRSISNLP